MYDLIVIGGGATGMGAAIKAKELGLNLLLIEENSHLGGSMEFCIHPQCGMRYYGKKLSGKEFKERTLSKFRNLQVSYKLHSTVIDISPQRDSIKITYVSPEGIFELESKSLVYAAGARERHRFEIGVFGDRVAGVYTSREAMNMISNYGIAPGRNILIADYANLGMNLARFLISNGLNVKAIIGSVDYEEDEGTAIYRDYKVLRVRGRKRVEKVIVSKNGDEIEIGGDALLLIGGLIPRVKLLEKAGVKFEDEALKDLKANVAGLFVAGNSLEPAYLSDNNLLQGERAGEMAAEYLKKI